MYSKRVEVELRMLGVERRGISRRGEKSNGYTGTIDDMISTLIEVEEFRQ